jgi:succinyl-diaminopimelate desuccinylase
MRKPDDAVIGAPSSTADEARRNSPVESIVELIQELVRIPSRADDDDYEPILRHIDAWLARHGIQSEWLPDKHARRRQKSLALTASIGGRDAPVYVLDATVDTASFGDPAAWKHGDPTSGTIEDGWLYGRGSADSKCAVAIFCHVAAALAADATRLAGQLAIVFDGDEHSGSFAGIQQFIRRAGGAGRIAGVMIGYPGNDKIGAGSRGFLRASWSIG